MNPLSAISMLDRVRIIGLLGNKLIEDLEPADVIKISTVLKMPLNTDEASGILQLIQTSDALTQTALSFLQVKLSDGTLAKMLSGGAVLPGEAEEFGEFDLMTRCPICHNPQLLDVREVNVGDDTICPHCDTSYPVVSN